MDDVMLLRLSLGLNVLMLALAWRPLSRHARAWAQRFRLPDATPATRPADFTNTEEFHWRAALFEGETPTPRAVVFLGDSLTEGGQWQSVWLGALPDPVLNRGIGGDTAEGVLRRVPEVVRHGPRAVFLMVGINDMRAFEHTPASLARKTRDVVRTIRSGCATTSIFVQSVLPAGAAMDSRVREANALLRGLDAPPEGIRFVDLHSLMAGPGGALREGLGIDGLHLSARGYAVWRNAVWPLVSPQTEIQHADH